MKADHYLSQIQAGLDLIEDRLDDDLRIAEVAQAAGISQWHFQRIFRGITGETVAVYIRGRRLSEAMDKLLESDQRILDIALMAGYETQESFTRAFTTAFDITPGECRRIGSRRQRPRKVEIDSDYLSHIASDVSREPELGSMPGMTLIGLGTRFDCPASEKNSMAEKLPALWDEFIPRIVEIPGLVPAVGYGVVAQVAPDDDALWYLAAAESVESFDLPSRMDRYSLPEREVATFAHRGDPRQLDNTVNYAYGNWLPRSGRRHSGDADLEIYGADYLPGSPDSVIHYAIPLA